MLALNQLKRWGLRRCPSWAHPLIVFFSRQAVVTVCRPSAQRSIAGARKSRRKAFARFRARRQMMSCMTVSSICSRT